MEHSETQLPTKAPQFSIKEVIEKAWDSVSGSKGSYWGAIALMVLVILALLLVRGLTAGIPQQDEQFTLNGFIFGILHTVVSVILTAGIFLMSIRRARGEPIRAMMIFDVTNKVGPLVLLAILIYVMLFVLPGIYLMIYYYIFAIPLYVNKSLIVGFLLFVLPGIYLMISYIFAIPLCVDKNLSPWQAMETSRKLVTSSWFKYFFTLVIVGIFYLISVIPLGIGAIWTLPLGYNLIGILYVQAFDRN